MENIPINYNAEGGSIWDEAIRDDEQEQTQYEREDEEEINSNEIKDGNSDS